ncbi:MAG: LPS export ABC transporter permease LptG [Paracoccaceae bacterium]
MTVHLYLLRRFSASLARVMGIIVSIVLLFDGVDNIRLLSKKGATFNQMIEYTLLKAPQNIYVAFSLIVLIASLTTFLSLARSSELVITRASGVSALRILSMPLAAALVFGILAVAAFNPIVASTTKRFEVFKAQFGLGSNNPLSVSEDGLWLRQGTKNGQTVIQAAHTNATGTELFGVRFFKFGDNGKIDLRIDAEKARLGHKEWLIQNASVWRFPGGDARGSTTPETRETTSLRTNLTSEQIADSFASPAAISIWKLPDFINRLEKSGFSAVRHRQYLLREIASPLLYVAMAMIGAAFTMRHARFGHAGVMVLMAVMSGFCLYFFRDVLNSFGGAGELPILISVWIPPLAGIMLSLALLLHLEDG